MKSLSVILTEHQYPILALFEILLFLDTFCNTNVSDYRTGEFGLSAWTLSLLSYLEKSIYQNSRVKSRALSRASENCCGGRLFRVHSTLPAGSVQLRIQHLWVKNLDKMLDLTKIQLLIRHFGAEKLDNELNIKWERTFLMTCSKTGDVFLRQRLSYLYQYWDTREKRYLQTYVRGDRMTAP